MTHPVPYLSPAPAQPVPQPAPGPDATAEFHQKLNSPQNWVIKQGVPIFKAHERTDPATGQLIRVDLPKLYRIAANMNRLEREGGVPIRMTLGHTEPGKPEVQQPPIGGYYKNARVQQFGPKGEPAVVVDEYLDPQYQGVRKNFPYRSAEYYDDAEQITGVALLTRDPYLDLGVVAYSRADTPLPYMVDESRPKPATHYSWNGRRPVMYHLVLGEPRMVPPNLYLDANGQPAAQSPYPQPDVAAQVAAVGAQPMGGQPGYAPAQPTAYGQAAQPQYPTQYQPQAAPTAYGIGGALSGAMTGGRLGAMAGPMGAAAGAAGGAMLGGMSGGGGSEPTRNAMYSAPWPPANGRQNHRPPPMHRQHPSGGAVYSQQTRYEDPPMGPGGPGGPPPEGGAGDPLQQLQMLLMAAVEVLGQVTGGAGGPPMGPGRPGGAPPGAGGPPPGPMPPEEGRDAPYSRYAAPGAQSQGRGAQRPRGGYAPYANNGDPVNYGYPYGVDQYGRPLPPPARRPAAPTPYGAAPPAGPVRTISGREPGAAMREAQLNYQLEQQNQAIRVLMYERDQADTQACYEAIQRLADAGYAVGEYEVTELKKRRQGDERQVYLDTIATKYQKVGTTPLPPLLGDPQPMGPEAAAPQGPATQAEMETALKIVAQNPSVSYTDALQYARQGAAPTAYGANRLAANYAGNLPGNVPGYPAAGFDPANPYGEFGGNGRH